MRSYIKFEGSSIKDGVKALEKLALDMPEVCIWNTFIESEAPMFNDQTGIMNYFAISDQGMEKRCATIVSKSGVALEGNDFVFEWFTPPSHEQIHMLTQRIDDVLSPLRLKYSINSK